MRIDNDFGRDGKSGHNTYFCCHRADLCGCCQSASDYINEQHYRNLVSGF